MGFIYALSDSRAIHEYRYVGMTKNPEQRLGHHIVVHRPIRSSYWIQSVLSAGARIQMTIIECVPDYEMPNREQMWIAALREAGYPLTNTSEGGNGGRVTAEGIAKMKAAWTPERHELHKRQMAAREWSVERRARHAARMRDWHAQKKAQKSSS